MADPAAPIVMRQLHHHNTTFFRILGCYMCCHPGLQDRRLCVWRVVSSPRQSASGLVEEPLQPGETVAFTLPPVASNSAYYSIRQGDRLFDRNQVIAGAAFLARFVEEGILCRWPEKHLNLLNARSLLSYTLYLVRAAFFFLRDVVHHPDHIANLGQLYRRIVQPLGHGIFTYEEKDSQIAIRTAETRELVSWLPGLNIVPAPLPPAVVPGEYLIDIPDDITVYFTAQDADLHAQEARARGAGEAWQAFDERFAEGEMDDDLPDNVRGVMGRPQEAAAPQDAANAFPDPQFHGLPEDPTLGNMLAQYNDLNSLGQIYPEIETVQTPAYNPAIAEEGYNTLSQILRAEREAENVAFPAPAQDGATFLAAWHARNPAPPATPTAAPRGAAAPALPIDPALTPGDQHEMPGSEDDPDYVPGPARNQGAGAAMAAAPAAATLRPLAPGPAPPAAASAMTKLERASLAFPLTANHLIQIAQILNHHTNTLLIDLIGAYVNSYGTRAALAIWKQPKQRDVPLAAGRADMIGSEHMMKQRFVVAMVVASHGELVAWLGEAAACDFCRGPRKKWVNGCYAYDGILGGRCANCIWVAEKRDCFV
ncbi:uncharacterized protein K452DRAFT_302889 [Aplosporella prunicola CBS 121167]|uniref:Uncharacterized protein n=1 Tax=Aplosporella prunicola CBS 121167 TaxID=1176127 RepID=A0A6A6AZU6_9PEZI|nr:uncharacterized protein K452DRAFT_302889 [Aplosporella prunicola CBS 121167]KAF2136297.1 hypothetical protein K452DRAFT_302889 [Aplosporella prunicola CBS 121167]